MAGRYANETIYSTSFEAGVAVNFRNKPRCRKRLTVREGGLIMRFP